MSDASRRNLRNLIRDRYDYFVSRLSYRLGSRDLADEALHDAFVRLERAELAVEIKQPSSYVLRMAMNIAANRRRREARMLSMEEVEAILDIPDDTADPAAAAEQHFNRKAVAGAMARLPERRRTMLVAMWLDEVPSTELATRHGVSVRTVQHEVRLALEQLREETAAPKVIPLRESDRRMS